MMNHRRLFLVMLVFVLLLFVLTGCAGPQGVQGPEGKQGSAGIGITAVTVNNEGHLIVSLSDGQTLDAGYVMGPTGPAGSSFTALIDKIEPTIVRIDVTLRNGLASGSGTIIDPRGYIVTNAHVVNGGLTYQVTLKDGSKLAAEVVGSDTNQDLAVIKMTSTRTDFPTMVLGTISDVLIGDKVMAVGFPGGTSLPGPATFTSGVVSAFRTYNGRNYIQTDTSINPGNSGGCMFNISGKMIGIPSAGITPSNEDFENINLVIPIDQVSAYINQYVK